MSLILIVDDESSHRLMLTAHLEQAGFEVEEASSGEDCLKMVFEQEKRIFPDLILLDLKMAGMNGLEVLENLRKNQFDRPVVIMTAHSSIDSALKAGRLGVKHYLTKPLDTDRLLLTIEELLKLRDIEEIQTRRAEELTRKFDFHEILGQSSAMLGLKEMLALVAPSEATVLITGESGTGKELVARALHKNSHRKENAFVAVNCAALAENLLESELFGHEKGAFTGAHQRKAGRFELAAHGTLFLDEIGEMAMTTQAKLLRVLEERAFERVGGTKTLQVDVRVLAATNRDLEIEIEKGAFREDLYYRLNVVQINVPSLRERGPGDIKVLADHLLNVSAERNHKPVKEFSSRALKGLTACPLAGKCKRVGQRGGTRRHPGSR